MYTKEEQAIRFVIKAFGKKKRIKEDIALAYHSIEVGFMLKNINCNEEIIISGLLHDIIEDTDYDYNYIKDNYGENIANNVLALSENKKILDWKERKIDFLKNLKLQSRDIIIIELADKLHNLLSDYDAWVINGNEAIATLSTTYDMNKWYYTEMKEIFNNNIEQSNELLTRYNYIYKLYFEQI